MSVIGTATNEVTATIAVGANPFGVAVTPDGGTVYVANAGFGANTMSAIATATNSLTKTITVGSEPGGVAVTPDGGKVYRELPLQQCVGDRHGNEYRDRHDPGRQRALRRGGHPRWLQGVCRERGFQRCVGDRHRDEYGGRCYHRRQRAGRVRCVHQPAELCRDARALGLSRLERLGVGPAVWRAQCRDRSPGIAEREGAAGCHSGILPRLAARSR